MRGWHGWVLAGLLLIAAGCQKQPTSGVVFIDSQPLTAEEATNLLGKISLEQQLVELTSANPEQDAAAYYKNGDSRLAAVFGFTFSVPKSLERPLPVERELSKPERTKLIAGAGGGDQISSDTEGKVQQAAREYARRYNDQMLSLLKM